MASRARWLESTAIHRVLEPVISTTYTYIGALAGESESERRQIYYYITFREAKPDFVNTIPMQYASTFPREAYRSSIDVRFGQVAHVLKEFFADLDDVEAIYLKGSGPFTIVIITNHDHYNPEALHTLFDREYHLHRQNSDLAFDITYIPRLDRDFSEIVSAETYEVFRR